MHLALWIREGVENPERLMEVKCPWPLRLVPEQTEDFPVTLEFLRDHSNRTSAKFSRFWTPSPLVRILSIEITQPPPPIVRNRPPPSLPLTADVICEWPLRQVWRLRAVLTIKGSSVGSHSESGYQAKSHLSASN